LTYEKQDTPCGMARVKLRNVTNNWIEIYQYMYNNGTSDDRSKIMNTNITGFANIKQCERPCIHVNKRGIWCEIQGDEILAVLFTNSVIKKKD